MEKIQEIIHFQIQRLVEVSIETGVIVDFLSDCRPRFDGHRGDLVASLIACLEDLESDVTDHKDRCIEDELWGGLGELGQRLRDYHAGAAGVQVSLAPIVDLAQKCLGQMIDSKRPKVRRAMWRRLRRLLLAFVWNDRSDRLNEILVRFHGIIGHNRSVLAFFEEEQSGPKSRVDLDLRQLVDYAIETQRTLANHKGVEFKLEVGPYPIVGVRKDLVRAIGNILNNAVKYSSLTKGGSAWIDIRSSESDGLLELSIESWGLPIPKDELESGRLTEFGYRGGLAKRSGYDGFGLGLADAYRVARDHGGRLDIASRPAVPAKKSYDNPYITTVTIWLPRKAG